MAKKAVLETTKKRSTKTSTTVRIPSETGGFKQHSNYMENNVNEEVSLPKKKRENGIKITKKSFNKNGIPVIETRNYDKAPAKRNVEEKEKNNVVEDKDKVKTIEIVKKKHSAITTELKQAPRHNVKPHVPSFEDKILRKIESIDKTIIELTELKFLLRKYKYDHDVRNKK